MNNSCWDSAVVIMLFPSSTTCLTWIPGGFSNGEPPQIIIASSKPSILGGSQWLEKPPYPSGCLVKCSSWGGADGQSHIVYDVFYDWIWLCLIICGVSWFCFANWWLQYSKVYSTIWIRWNCLGTHSELMALHIRTAPSKSCEIRESRKPAHETRFWAANRPIY